MVNVKIRKLGVWYSRVIIMTIRFQRVDLRIHVSLDLTGKSGDRRHGL